MGRPETVLELTNEQKELAIELAVAGEPLRVIIDELMVSEYAFWKSRERDPNFDSLYEQARQEGLEHLGDALMTAHRDEVDVQRGRLKSDNLKWLLSKRKPQIYGDKIDVHVTQTIDIAGALKDAKARAATAIDVNHRRLSEGNAAEIESDAAALERNEKAK